MRRKEVFLIICTLLFSLSLSAADYVVEKWNWVDISLKTSNKFRNPFEIQVNVSFKLSESTEEVNIPAFYNGGNEWIARFMAPTEGKWNFEVHSSLKFKSATGIIEVRGPKEGSRGMVVLDKDRPGKLSYQNGSEYFLLASEIDWLFALDYGNPELPKTKEMLKRIKDAGFNHVVMNVYAWDISWGKDSAIPERYDFGSREEIFPFLGSNSKPDHSGLNLNFFNHLDKVVALLDDMKIESHLMIYVWNKGVSWPVPGSREDNRYFDYVIKRYQGFPNIVWDISKEALAYGRDDMGYITERIARVDSLDAYHHLKTVHDYKYCRNFPDMVDFISIQDWNTDLYSIMRERKDFFKDKPVLNIEHGGYEAGPYQVYKGDYLDAKSCLNRNYECIFSGTYTTHYWQCYVWSVIYYDFWNLPVNEQPKLNYFRVMKNIFTENNFSEFYPVDYVSTSGYVLKNDQDTYLFYVPEDNDLIHVYKIFKEYNGLVEMEYTNVFTGKKSVTETHSSGWMTIAPPVKGEPFVVKVLRKDKIVQ